MGCTCLQSVDDEILKYFTLFFQHEIVGVVKKIGSSVKHYKIGDHVGVGTYVDSCGDCEYCNEKLEVYCSKGATSTFDGIDSDGTIAKGGYSKYIVVKERYCYRELHAAAVPRELRAAAISPVAFPAAAAPHSGRLHSCPRRPRHGPIVSPPCSLDSSATKTHRPSTCLVKNHRQKVVAMGRINGEVVLSNETYNIVLDNIYEPKENLYDRYEKFGDFRIGDLITWTKGFVEVIGV